MDWKLEGGL